jgi:hypothetical protein
MKARNRKAGFWIFAFAETRCHKREKQAFSTARIDGILKAEKTGLSERSA